MAANTQPRRLSYLLRLWQAGNGDAPQWRLSLQDTRTHTIHGFADLASLVVFLEIQLEQGTASPAPEKQPGKG